MNDRERAIKKELLKRKIERLIEKSKVSFWEYEKTRNMIFFSEDKLHLKKIAVKLQLLYENKLMNPYTNQPYKKMMINIPPRHGKTFSLINFCEWLLGINNTNKIISISYNEILGIRFAKNVRNTIQATKKEGWRIIYNDIFPNIKIKHGDAASQIWSLEGYYFNFLSSSYNATLTGMGCNIGIIDDPIKSKKEALNERLLDEQWEWYRDTYLSRIEENAIQIINMTRWATKDLCGRLLKTEPNEWCQIKMAAYNEETGKMLCPEILSYATYINKTKKGMTSPEIIKANYDQEPIDIEGVLYKKFEIYDPTKKYKFDFIISYTDTADTGDNYLCSVIAGVKDGEGYLLDVYFSQEGMEITEPETAKRFSKYYVQKAKIESNSGGRGFARNVERLLWETHKNRIVNIFWFHQTENKIARILGNSTFIMNHIYFPADWASRWPEYYISMTTFQSQGKNKYDDAQDAITGLAEMIIFETQQLLLDQRESDKVSVYW